MALLKKSYRWTFGLPLDFRFLPPQVQPFSHFVFLFVLFYQSFRFRLSRKLSVRFPAGKENLIMASSLTSTLFVDFRN